MANNKQPSTPTNVRWGIFALACGTSWLLYLHRYSFALMKPKLAEEWNLDNADLGLLDSVFFSCYTLFQVPLGMAVDAWGVRLVLTGMLLAGTLGLAMHAWAPANREMWWARAVFGFGQSAVYAALSRVSRQWFPPAVRTMLQGFVGVTFGRLGGLSAYVVFSIVLIAFLGLDWRTATLIFAAVGLAQAVVFYVAFRNTPREHPLANEAEAELIEGNVGATTGIAPTAALPRLTVLTMLRQLSPLGLLNLSALTLQSFLSTFADNFYSSWTPKFLADVYKLEDSALGYCSALPLLGGALGGIVGGWLSDKCIAWTGNRRWSRSGVAAACKGLAAVWLVLALACYQNPYLFCAMLFLVKLFGDGSLSTHWGVVTDIGGRATGSVYAISNAVAGFGAIAASPVFGYLSKHYGWQPVILAVAGFYVLCAISWLAVNCTVPLLEENEKTENSGTGK